MAHGLTAALDIAGSAPRRLLRTAPVVTTVGGWAAADLRLLGAAPPTHRWLALLNPAPGARRLGAAWRVGRLTAALPGLAADLVADIDRRLAQIPAPGELPGPDLAAQLRWTRTALVSLHAQEALAGALLHEPPKSRTAAGAALTALAETRALGIPDERATAVAPTVLALTAPSLRGHGRLPQGAPAGSVPGSAFTSAHDTNDPSPSPPISPSPSPTPASHHSPTPLTASRAPALPPRESLRLRIRWVQELQVRLVREAARRLGPATAERVGLLRWPELAAVLDGEPCPVISTRACRRPSRRRCRTPSGWRRRARWSPNAPAARPTVTVTAGACPAGGPSGRSGTGPGRVPDAVLVVRTLDPALAPLLPELTALVAQTGSALSHLALLAREFGLPAVVGAADAVRRFPPGSRVAVDGTTGDVRPGEVRTGEMRTGEVLTGNERTEGDGR